jgi:hypothetical protein
MRAVASLLLIAVLADTPATVPAQIRLKNGTVYRLKEPPFRKDGRMIFTTTDGKVYSLDETEVSEVRLLSPTPTPRTAPNPQDSHDLGAIARQQNHKTGKHTLVAPAPTPRPTPEPGP